MRPRTVCAETGEAVVLEELVAAWLETAIDGSAEVVGGPGLGKSTALAHLAAVLPAERNVVYLDDAVAAQVIEAAISQPVVYTTHERLPVEPARSYRLVAWGDDELIEYLLAACPTRCRSVMARVGAMSDRRMLQGNPELWRTVLERLVGDEAAADWRTILRGAMDGLPPRSDVRRCAQCAALAKLCETETMYAHYVNKLRSAGVEERLLRLLRHRPVQLLMASDWLLQLLETRARPAPLAQTLPRDLVKEAGAAAVCSPAVLDSLRVLLTLDDKSIPPKAAGMLHAARVGWVPDGGPLELAGAYLDSARWPEVDLGGANLEQADLSQADLTGARLRKAIAAKACFRQAKLSRADLVDFSAIQADLEGAEMQGCLAGRANFRRARLRGANLAGARLDFAQLQGADLNSACLRGTSLIEARLDGAQIEDADFSAADFHGARLVGLPLRLAEFAGASFKTANLLECDMEGVSLPEASFEGANLTGALLTGSVMPRADFRGAVLRGAGLADVDWERADLRRADLRGSSFYLGSTRSGLVGSPLACEGSRTGFYTDDYDEQPFKAPEEIRKANLRGADLRGARIDGVDFYLVDLREAHYTAEQAEHFRRCGAILVDRAAQGNDG